jgi:LPXTG-site transpeptidase (sortase) family protein
MTPTCKRWLRAALNGLIGIGLFTAGWPLGQTGYALWSQHRLRAAWQLAAQAAPPRPVPARLAKPGRVAAKRTKHTVASRPSSPVSEVVLLPTPSDSEAATLPFWPATRLVIPDINLDVVVVQGTSPAALRQGPGHDPDSALPGQPGLCLIAGHRNIWGAWFYHLEELQPGALLQLHTPGRSFTYRVTALETVPETDTSVLDRAAYPSNTAQLVLVTCTLPHSPHRVLLTAELV